MHRARPVGGDGDARLRVLHDPDILDTASEEAFDDMALLAGQLCAAPVALVSLVGADRQWFKARIGFAKSETDLDRSVSRFVVATGEVVEIPDLAADARTRDNPLVTGEPFIRFYAGAPLVTDDGHVLGALCVLDDRPRPGGLTDPQRDGLQALARRVTAAIEARRLAREHVAIVAERDRINAERAANERHWERLFLTLQEGIIIGRVVRDQAGRGIDWRYEQVNEAGSALSGVPVEEARGRTIREVFPGIEDEWVQESIDAAEAGKSVRFRRQVGSLGRWYDGTVQPADRDSFTVLFLDVTDEVQATKRQNALLELGDALRDCDTVGDMTRRAAEIAGTCLDASRAGYGVVDADVERIDIEPDWTADGVASIEGSYRSDDLGDLTATLQRGDPLIIEDIMTDPRTAADPGPLRALGIGSMVNVPARERGRVLAMFIVHSAVPRRWTEPDLTFIRNVADRLEVGIARLRAEGRQEVLNGEIAHRLKNSLAMVQAIANQTLRTAADRTSLEAFSKRLLALGTAHEALLGRDLQAADLEPLAGRVLDTAGIAGRYTLDGPPTRLGARAALSTSLLLHELATNALKYGALAVGGEVSVSWRSDGQDESDVILEWRESGGPPVGPPARTGFGTKLLKLGLTGTGGSDLRYGPDGFGATFRATRRHLEQA